MILIRPTTTKTKAELESELLDICRNVDAFTNSDLRGAIEAFVTFNCKYL